MLIGNKLTIKLKPSWLAIVFKILEDTVEAIIKTSWGEESLCK